MAKTKATAGKCGARMTGKALRRTKSAAAGKSRNVRTRRTFK